MKNLLNILARLPIRFYQLVISPLNPNCCRFTPTCSEYSLTAIKAHGIIKGTWLTTKRILKCHPWSEQRFDPVPPTKGK